MSTKTLKTSSTELLLIGLIAITIMMGILYGCVIWSIYKSNFEQQYETFVNYQQISNINKELFTKKYKIETELDTINKGVK